METQVKNYCIVKIATKEKKITQGNSIYRNLDITDHK
jgi:hypothetical protein